MPQQTAKQQAEADALLQARKRDFEPIRRLLIEKGVPFDPDVLLSQDWPIRLAPVFAQMPEMQEVRFHETPIKGVLMAKTLYLPEKVETTGDTIIIAENIVFEGNDSVIRGNHILHFLPFRKVSHLGMTVKEFRTRQQKEMKRLGIEGPICLPKEPVAEERWKVTTIPVSQENQLIWLNQSDIRQGATIRLVSIAGPGSVAWKSDAPSSENFAEIRARISLPYDDLRLALVVLDRKRVVRISSVAYTNIAEDNEREYTFKLQIPPDALALDLEFVVHKNRYIEFPICHSKP
ncbi:MAG: hypothetical protein AB1631_24010 [Acidobacteriota bacterium]